MLKVVRVNGSEFSVTGEGIEVVVNWYSWSDSKVSGKGSRTNKESILKAVQNFIINERDMKKLEMNNKAKAFKSTLKDVNLYAIYNTTSFFTDDWDQVKGTTDKLLTGMELISASNVIAASLHEVKNNEFYQIGSGRDTHTKRTAIAEKRYLIVLDTIYVTGLTLKEIVTEGMKFYDRGFKLCTPWDVTRIMQAKDNTQQVQMLFTKEPEGQKQEMANRIKNEIDRANNTSEIVEYKELKGFTKEGKEIRGNWFASKPCSIEEVKEMSYSTYDNYVVLETVTFDRDTFEMFALSLNMDLLNVKFEGGTSSTTCNDIHENTDSVNWTDEMLSIWCLGCYRECLEVKCNELEYSLILDPQGYDYPRYVAINGNYNNDLKDDTFEVTEINIPLVNTAEEAKEEVSKIQTDNAKFTIKESKHTKTNETIFVANPIQRLSRDEFKELSEQIKTLGGYYSSFKPNNGFIFKTDPTSILNGLHDITEEEAELEQQEEVNNVTDFQEYKNNITGSENDLTENFIDMFDDIKIENTSRIASDDQEFCEHQEKLYIDAVTLFKKTLDIMEKMYASFEGESWRKDGYIQEHDDIWNMRDRIIKVKNDHVNKICRYFENKYNVTIDESSIGQKYKDRDISYQQILDEIFIQLGGYSFEEKAVNEIKEAMKNATKSYHSDTSRTSIKNNKVIFENLYLTSYCNIFKKYELTYGSNKNVLFEALSHFDHGSTESHWKFTNYYNDRSNEDVIFSKNEVNLSKVKSMKLFKNGKVEVEFNSNQSALQFAKEYCNHSENNSKTA